jgi:hypothetical protein
VFYVEVQAKLPGGETVPVTGTSENRLLAIRIALDSMPLGSVAVRSVVTEVNSPESRPTV